MTDPITFSSSAGATGSTGSGSQTTTTNNSQVTKNEFLQLLVAQIQNQDPLNPTDGVQFLTQLAQFQQLEQSMNMGEDMAAARADLDKLVQTTTAATNASQTN